MLNERETKLLGQVIIRDDWTNNNAIILRNTNLKQAPTYEMKKQILSIKLVSVIDASEELSMSICETITSKCHSSEYQTGRK